MTLGITFIVLIDPVTQTGTTIGYGFSPDKHVNCGYEPERHSSPEYVALWDIEEKQHRKICGGVLINENWVVSSGRGIDFFL